MIIAKIHDFNTHNISRLSKLYFFSAVAIMRKTKYIEVQVAITIKTSLDHWPSTQGKADRIS